MKRRSFIQTAAVSLAGCIPKVWMVSASTPYWTALAFPELLHMVEDTGEVARIGLAYRQNHPQLDSPEKLVETIHTTASSESIDIRVRADFIEGRTVQINGWILSLTEARQCALFSFLQT